VVPAEPTELAATATRTDAASAETICLIIGYPEAGTPALELDQLPLSDHDNPVVG
jgi:hypothetical protein